ncbi:MAG: hypothetical protein CME70_11280 [Halobacteriovorax sp.]|nr:hypothetical protein [Halobacteriovorax sp.]|tara:strand:+ start:95579 stop:95791 length:213 start_codon:yes stop_codon:yes gene_type:complete
MKKLVLVSILFVITVNFSFAADSMESSYGENLSVPGEGKTLCPLARAAAEKAKSNIVIEGPIINSTTISK